MDALQEKEALKNLPLRKDCTIDIKEMKRRKPEPMVSQIMNWQVDEPCGEAKTH